MNTNSISARLQLSSALTCHSSSTQTSAQSYLKKIGMALQNRHLLVESFHKNQFNNSPQSNYPEKIKGNLTELFNISQYLSKGISDSSFPVNVEEGNLFFQYQLLIETLRLEQRSFPDLYNEGYPSIQKVDALISTIQSLRKGDTPSSAQLPPQQQPRPLPAPPPPKTDCTKQDEPSPDSLKKGRPLPIPHKTGCPEHSPPPASRQLHMQKEGSPSPTSRRALTSPVDFRKNQQSQSFSRVPPPLPTTKPPPIPQKKSSGNSSPASARFRKELSASLLSSKTNPHMQSGPLSSEHEQICTLLHSLNPDQKTRSFKQIEIEQLIPKTIELITETRTLLQEVFSTTKKEEWERRIKKAEIALSTLQGSFLYPKESPDELPIGQAKLLAVSLVVYQQRLHTALSLASEQVIAINKCCLKMLECFTKLTSSHSEKEEITALCTAYQCYLEANSLFLSDQTASSLYSSVAKKIIFQKLNFFYTLIEEKISSIQISQEEIAAAKGLFSSNKVTDGAYLFIAKSLLLSDFNRPFDTGLTRDCLSYLMTNKKMPKELQPLTQKFQDKKFAPSSQTEQRISLLKTRIRSIKTPSWQNILSILPEFLEISQLTQQNPDQMPDQMKECFEELRSLALRTELLTPNKKSLATKLLESELTASGILTTKKKALANKLLESDIPASDRLTTAVANKLLASNGSVSPALHKVRSIVCPLYIEAFLKIERNQELIDQLPTLFNRISEDCSTKGAQLKKEIKNDPDIPLMIVLSLAKRETLWNSLLSILATDIPPQQYKKAATELFEKQEEVSQKSFFLASLVLEWLQNTFHRSISKIPSIQQEYIAPIKNALQGLLVAKGVEEYFQIESKYISLLETFTKELSTFLPDSLYRQTVLKWSEFATFFDAAQDSLLSLPDVKSSIASAKEELKSTISTILSETTIKAMVERFRQKEMLDRIRAPFSEFPEDFQHHLLRVVFDIDGLYENKSSPQDLLVYYTTLLIASSGPYKNASFEAKLLAAPQIPKEAKKEFRTMEMLRRAYNGLNIRPKSDTTDLSKLHGALGDLLELIEAKSQEIRPSASPEDNSLSSALASLEKLQKVIPKDSSHLSEGETIALLTHESLTEFIQNLRSAFQALSQSTSPNTTNLKGQMMSTLMRYSSIIKTALNECATLQYRENLLEVYRKIRKTLREEDANIAS